MLGRALFVAILFVQTLPAALAAGDLKDPFEILDRSFEAAGGLDRLEAERTSYMEGVLQAAGLEGTFKLWTEIPGRTRVEADLGVLRMTQVEDGDTEWTLDTNGKLQQSTHPSEAALARKRVRRLLAQFAYADPRSDLFDVSLAGIERSEGREWYAIRIDNSINDDFRIDYINTESLLVDKRVSFEGEDSNDTYYEDYREVDGLMVSYRIRQILHQTGQVETMILQRYESNPTLDGALFVPPSDDVKDYRFTNGTCAENIPFHLIGSHLFLTVTVGCKEGLWIVDTGAGMTVVDQSVADALGLEMQGELDAAGAGGTVQLQLATLPSYTVQGIEFDEQVVAVLDMRALQSFLGVKLAGILGFDFLSRFVIRVDYAGETLSFFDPQTFEYSGSGREIDLHVRDNSFYVAATLDGEHTGTWLFDLGAGTTMLDGPFAARNGYAERPGMEGLAHGAGHGFRTKRVHADTLEFAGFTLDDPPVSFVESSANAESISDQLGILGNSVFRNFVLYVDLNGERVIVEKGSEFNEAFPENRSGLVLKGDDEGGCEVLFVADGSPAQEAGFAEHDVVRAINGIDVEYLDGVIAVRELLSGEPGSRFTFTVRRDGGDRQLELTLRDLYRRPGPGA